VLISLAAGGVLIGCFVARERRVKAPMLPMRFFGNRTFAATNAVSFVMYLGLFGSAFLLTQYLQTAHCYSPLQAGLRTLPWTACRCSSRRSPGFCPTGSAGDHS
jgi:hypothetical protein